MPRVTMKDVASVMGVSVMTVSNAFNRPDQLSPDLRTRILARASKMGYTGPDAAARHLRSGQTNTFAVMFQEHLSYAFSDPFTVLWLTAFSRVMETRGASVLLLSVPAVDAQARAAIQNTSADGVAGLCADQIGLQLARERGIPVVVSSLAARPDPAGDTGDYVAIDDFQAGLDMAHHLRRLGHRRVDVLVEHLHSDLPPGIHAVDGSSNQARTQADPTRFVGSWLRLQGVVRGLQGLDVRLVAAGSNQRPLARQASSTVLDQQDRPTAVLAISDVLALGFMDACADRGIRPGADISVSGFDDLPEAEAAGLTTVAQPIEDKGRLAAELLLDPHLQPRQIVLPHQLIVRATTRPAGLS